MKITVTGGAGFIGSNIVEKLLEQGHKVTVIDNFKTGDPTNLEIEPKKRLPANAQLEILKGSINNQNRVNEAITRETDVVMHLAAYSSSGHHRDDAIGGIRTNIEASYRLMERSVDMDVDKFVYATTSSMYGNQATPQSIENGYGEAENLYAASKMAMERYAEAMHKTKDLSTIGLRLFSVYGPNEEAKGELCNVVTKFTRMMLNDETPPVYEDGTQTRDFIHVSDVVDAFITAAQSDLENEILDIGTGQKHSMNQVVSKINDELGKDITPEYMEAPMDNYVEKTQAETNRTLNILGWEAETMLDEGIQKQVKEYGDGK